MDNKCFHFEKRNYDDGFFNESIDSTYIIHLEGNGRLKSINNQLDNFHPTNLVYIVFNKGYKKCEKKHNIDKPEKDLLDAFLTIFKHAKEKKYNNILILEDDFLFSSKIKDKYHVENINNFLNKHIESNIQYALGEIPWLRMPYIYDNNHSISFISSGSHAIVYTKSNREKILQEKEEKLIEWDWDIYNVFYHRRYLYHIPLCYQLFGETDNRKRWGIQNPLIRISAIIVIYIFDFLKMDKYVEPGYSYFYNFSIILFFIILVLLFVITLYFCIYSYRIYRKINLKKIKRLLL